MTSRTSRTSPISRRSGMSGRLAIGRLAVLVAACAACGGSSPDPPDPGAVPKGACEGPRALTCAFFDGTEGAWSYDPPSRVSLATACAPAGLRGEIDALVETPGQYWLDRIGFQASGSAVRTAAISASDDAGGTTYGCGQGGGRILTQLLCGTTVGLGTLALRFDFAGRWADGTPWTKECDARVEVSP
jgi:hypothetical protein